MKWGPFLVPKKGNKQSQLNKETISIHKLGSNRSKGVALQKANFF